ncbi:hypothetical protein [Spiroplasma culicicola]|uniref:Transmembrane protein n=1 Tax=Spiroplasma culicicola AES-1 TaxID=1276246 RepID=W6AH12_9MOLU|nr:hypothetical protein [Spiroplasma culicicola]AHI52979.1 hypothetical protein SCULI_v1c06380 [Spiroplasma culicicola AES-1]
MNQREIYVLTIVLIWIMFLTITGLLAWIYHNKIKGLKTIRQEYETKIKEYQKTFSLSVQNIKYELPQDQTCYYFSSADLYLKKIKKNNKPAKIDYKFMYKAKKLSKVEGQVYLTNKYLLVEYGEFQIKTKIDEIVSIYQFTFFNGVEWIKGIEILLNEIRILVDTKDINLLFAYKALKGEKQ